MKIKKYKKLFFLGLVGGVISPFLISASQPYTRFLNIPTTWYYQNTTETTETLNTSQYTLYYYKNNRSRYDFFRNWTWNDINKNYRPKTTNRVGWIRYDNIVYGPPGPGGDNGYNEGSEIANETSFSKNNYEWIVRNIDYNGIAVINEEGKKKIKNLHQYVLSRLQPNDEIIRFEILYYYDDVRFKASSYNGHVPSNLNDDLDEIRFKVVIRKRKTQTFGSNLNTYWNSWKQILNNHQSITLNSDTMGDLNTQKNSFSSSQIAFKSNIQLLNEYTQELNKQVNNSSNSDGLILVWRQVDGRTINWILRRNDGRGESIILSNVKVTFRPSDNYNDISLENRLEIRLGKWVDFENNTTALVDDKMVRDPNDSKSLGTTSKNKNDKKPGRRVWGGRWIVHSPLKVLFNTTLKENEVLLINGKKIEVLDRFFEEELRDLRKDANDNERVFDSNFIPDNEEEKDDFNSHFKNEYKIQIISYSKPGNNDKDIESIYERVLVVNSKSSQEDFRWFAWKPNENPQQKELIEECVLDKNGKPKTNNKGELIKNPKYDASIDKSTGTKKELLLFDFGIYNQQKMFEDQNDFSFLYSDSNRNYYSKTKLPANTKWLFKPHNNLNLNRKVIVEAIVLGSGGLQQLIGENVNFNLFKLKINRTSNHLVFEKINNKYYKELSLEQGENSYFSESGIWLFTSNAQNSISNFKIVLVKENSNPQSLFSDNISLLSKQIQPLFKTNDGAQLYNYIQTKHELKKEEITSLKYEEVLEYYKSLVNDLYLNKQYNNYYLVYPKFNKLTDSKYTEKEFKEKYLENNQFNKLKEILFANFEFSDLTYIKNASISEDKKTLRIFVGLKDNNVAYQLVNTNFEIPIKFKGHNDTNNFSYINLELDIKKINEIASINPINNFINELNKRKLEMFVGLSDEDFNKISIINEFNTGYKMLNITIELIDKFKTTHKLTPTNFFSIKINNFMEEDNNLVNPKQEDDNLLEKEKYENIFESFQLKKINLKGIEDYNKAKELILSEVRNNLDNRLVYEKDYIIRNLDNAINERLVVDIGVSEEEAPFSIIRIQSLIDGKKVGDVPIKIFNFVKRILNEDYDLSTKKLIPLTINEKLKSKLIQKIKDYINESFSVDGFRYSDELEIENLEEGINVLSLGSGVNFDFKIIGSNKRILNSTYLNVSNNAEYVVNDLDSNYKPGDENDISKRIVYDLSNVAIELKGYKHFKGSVLRQEIYDATTKLIKEKYKIDIFKHYDFDYNELDKEVKLLIKKSKEAIRTKIKLVPIEGVTKNNGLVEIENWNEFNDPIDDLNEVKLIKNKLSEEEAEAIRKNKEEKEKQKRVLLLTFIPIGLVVLGLIIILVSFVYIRKFRNKVR